MIKEELAEEEKMNKFAERTDAQDMISEGINENDPNLKAFNNMVSKEEIEQPLFNEHVANA